MVMRRLRWPLRVLGLLSAISSIAVRGVLASSCPGDSNNDGQVTVNELILGVNAALNGCASVPAQSTLLETGQTQCDQGSGTLDVCPGSPPGQDSAIGAGAPISYTDNGDGTIGNIATGLTWEKLSNDSGIHDFSNSYTWSDAINVKIAALNSAPCFAGHCDWRLPNRRELESLVDAGQVGPAINAAFNSGCNSLCTVTTCSCTQLDYYWSSTTEQDLPNFAWNVDFNVGAVNGFEKSLTFYVRAVRGGL